MKFYFGLFLICMVTNWIAAAPSSDASYLVGIRGSELSPISQSELFLMKITQRIASTFLLPEQKSKADAIVSTSKENFQKCENEYLMHSLYSLYKTCLRQYTRIAMSQIHTLELQSKPEYMLTTSMIMSSDLGEPSQHQENMRLNDNIDSSNNFNSNGNSDNDSNNKNDSWNN